MKISQFCPAGKTPSRPAKDSSAEPMDRGVNYIDTARGYGNAEQALGHLVPKRRDKLFLVTKCWTDSAAEAEKSLSESLRQLKTDHVDLCHIHHIGGSAKRGIRAAIHTLNATGTNRSVGLRPAVGANPWSALRTGHLDAIDTVDQLSQSSQASSVEAEYQTR
jgi:aryl-alcohol dehydrogenase-like predicted oxidoreductase